MSLTGATALRHISVSLHDVLFCRHNARQLVSGARRSKWQTQRSSRAAMAPISYSLTRCSWFRLDDDVWATLPHYRDHGFAVFKLKAGDQKIHPMAFRSRPAIPRGCCFRPCMSTTAGSARRQSSITRCTSRGAPTGNPRPSPRACASSWTGRRGWSPRLRCTGPRCAASSAIRTPGSDAVSSMTRHREVAPVAAAARCSSSCRDRPAR